MRLECPFPIVTLVAVEDYRLALAPLDDGLWHQAERSFHFQDVHVEEHYCTHKMIPNDHLTPTMSVLSRWPESTHGNRQVCGRVEINPRTSQFGVCMYTDLLYNIGLTEALGLDTLDWPSWMPTREGRYPIFWWQEGGGEDFDCGFTLEQDDGSGYEWAKYA